MSATDVAIAGGGTPAISSFTPTSGPVGSIVTVYGTNFSGATSVKFNGTAADAVGVDSSTQIRALVPVGSDHRTDLGDDARRCGHECDGLHGHGWRWW